MTGLAALLAGYNPGDCPAKGISGAGHCGFWDPGGDFVDINAILPEIIAVALRSELCLKYLIREYFVLKKLIYCAAVFGASLSSCAAADTEWLRNSDGRWCIAYSSKTICLSEDYEMERVSSSAIDLAYRREILPSVFATFFDRVRSPEDVNPYPDSSMKLQSVRSVNGVSVSKFEFRDASMGGPNYGFFLLVFDESFTLVLNGNAKELIEAEVDSLLDQWGRDAS